MTLTMLAILTNAAKRSEQLQADRELLRRFAPVMYVSEGSGEVFKEALDLLADQHDTLVQETKRVLDSHIKYSKKEAE